MKISRISVEVRLLYYRPPYGAINDTGEIKRRYADDPLECGYTGLEDEEYTEHN